MYKQIVRITTDSKFSLIFCSYDNKNHCDDSIQNETRFFSLEIAWIISKDFYLHFNFEDYELWAQRQQLVILVTWACYHQICMSPWSWEQERCSQPIPSRSESGPKRSTAEIAFQFQNNESSHFYCSTFVWLASMLNLSSFTVMVTADTGSPTNCAGLPCCYLESLQSFLLDYCRF